MEKIKKILWFLLITLIVLFMAVIVWLLFRIAVIIVACVLIALAIYFGYKATLGRYDKDNFI
jgi:Flp pilus assembly protein TadB